MPDVGDPAPQFTRTILGTKEIFKLKDYLGDVVVLAFSGLTWCGPCKEEAPILEDMWQEFQTGCYKPNVWFVMIAVNDPPEKLPAEIKKYGITFPVIVADDWLLKAYKATSVPRLYVVGPDPDQKICAAQGAVDADLLRSLLLEDCGVSKRLLCGLDDSRWLAVAQILFGVTQDAGGVIIVGGKPRPVPPWDPLRRNALLALAISQLAVGVSDSESRRAIERGALDALGAAVKRMRERSGRKPIAYGADRMPVPVGKGKGG